MASGTADLQRDLGGAIMQSIFGALLTAGYAAAASAAITASGKSVSDSVESQLTKSFDGAEAIAQQYPPSIQQDIIAGAKTSFLHGDQWAYLAGIVAVLLGAAVVFLFFPKRDDEQRLLTSTTPRTPAVKIQAPEAQAKREGRRAHTSTSPRADQQGAGGYVPHITHRGIHPVRRPPLRRTWFSARKA